MKTKGSPGIIVSLLIISLLLAACQPTASTGPSAQGTTAPLAAKISDKPEGTLNIGLSAWGNGLIDPPVAGSRDKAQLHLMFDWLVGASIDGRDISTDTGIANKWVESPDGSSWTFSIRKGIEFHDGYGEVTAEDVKFSIDRLLTSPKTKTEYASSLRAVIGDIQVVDPYTVKFNMKKPDFTLAYELSPIMGVEGIIVSKKQIDKVGEDVFSQRPAGTGPYKFVELAEGSYIKFQAIDKHFSIGVPKFKEVYIRLIHEESTRIAMLKTGELDVIDHSIDRASELEKDFTNAQREGGSNLIIYILGQWNPAGALGDKRVRQALDLAVDREALLRTLFRGKGAILPGFKVPTWAKGAKDLAPHPYDPAKAKALLQEAGQSNLTIEYVTSPAWNLVSQAIAGQLEKAGFKVKISTMDDGAIEAKYRLRSTVMDNPPLNAVNTYAIVNRPFALGLFTSSFMMDSGWPLLQDKKLDGLITDWRNSKSIEEYSSRIVPVQEYIDKEFLAIPLIEIHDLFAANPKKVGAWNAGGIIMRDPGVRELVRQGK